jgi:hypothetical protein
MTTDHAVYYNPYSEHVKWNLLCIRRPAPAVQYVPHSKCDRGVWRLVPGSLLPYA